MSNLGTGIANGIAAGLQGYSQGTARGMQMANAQNSERRKQQLQAKQLEQLKYQADTRTPVDDVKKQQELMAKKNKLLTTKLTKQMTFDAFSSYNADGDVRHINNALKDLSDIMPNVYVPGTVVMKIDPENDSSLVNQMIQKGVIKKWGPKASKSFLKVFKPGETEPSVFDINQLQASTGYTKHMTQEQFAQYAQEVAIAKDKSTAELNMAKAKAVLNPKPSSSRRDTLKQLRTVNSSAMFGKPFDKLTAEQQHEVDATASIVMNQGKGAAKENSDINQLTNIVKENIDMYTSGKYDKDKAIYNEQAYIKQAKDTKPLIAAQTTLNANAQVISQVDKILSGSAVKVDKDIISNAKTYAEKIFGKKDAQAFDNVNYDTQVGMILADYLHAKSGTAVAESERAFIKNLITGGDLADETYQRKALESFKNFMYTQGKSVADTYMDKLPYSAHKFTDTASIKDTKPHTVNGPEIGTISNGYKFLGGNPNDPKSWEEVK